MSSNKDTAAEESLEEEKWEDHASNTRGVATSRNYQKVIWIETACICKDLQALRDLATSEGGLISDEVRRIAWPLLLGSSSSSGISYQDWKQRDRHPDEEQVQLDVNRSFVYYPENETAKTIDLYKRELSDLITAVLRAHPLLCYFQGFHDIAQVLLLVLGNVEVAQSVVARLSLLRIRDFMLPTLAGAELHLRLIPPILYAADPELYRHLSSASQPAPFFALAATLTLYAHDIEDYANIVRLFDFLLVNEAAMPIYLYAAIILSRKDQLLEIEPDDSSMLHFTLSKLPKPLKLEEWIREAVKLFQQHPPQSLPNRAWSRISKSSVLKTTQDLDALAKQTLQDGERLFAEQAAEFEQQERRKQLRQNMWKLLNRYKLPAGWTSAAVLAVLLALYLGKYDIPPANQGFMSTALASCRRAYGMLLGVLG